MNKEQVLQNFGLTEAEVKVYILLLAEGEATASQVAGKTSTNRTFTYDRLKKLLDAGLVSYVIKDHKKYFKAAPPGILLDLLKEKEAQVKTILPELENLKTEKQKGPEIDVFSSKKGVRTVLNSLLKEKKPVYIHGSIDSFKRSMEDFYSIWNNRRATLKIRAMVLSSDSADIPFADVDFLSEEQSTAISTFTCADKVVMILWGESPVAILIKSPQLAQDSVMFFNNIWDREIKIYSGVQGIRKAFIELVSRETSEHVGIGYSLSLAQVYGKEFSDEWHKIRIKNGVKSKLIAYDDEDSTKYFDKRMMNWKDFNIKFLPRELCGPACVTLSDHLIVTFIYTEKKLKVIVNKNKETIAVYKKFFHQLWKKAKA